MTFDRKKLTIASAIAWSVVTIPFATIFSDGHLAMWLFWFTLFLYPLWFTFGWKWVTDACIPANLWILLAATGIPMAMYFADSRDYDDVFYLPLLTSSVLIYFVWLAQGSHWQWKKVKTLGYHPPLWLMLIAVFSIMFFAQLLAEVIPPFIGSVIATYMFLFWLAYKAITKGWANKIQAYGFAIFLCIMATWGHIEAHMAIEAQKKENARQTETAWQEYLANEQAREQERCERLREESPAIYQHMTECHALIPR